MNTSENGGFLGHTCFFSQNAILFHLQSIVAVNKIALEGIKLDSEIS